MKPTITVIIPIYNVEKYLERCLSSLQNQSFSDFEALCIDDGSTDNSGSLADTFAAKDARFRVIHQQNKGLSGARNTGIAAAQGDFVFFLDSDDYIHPRTLEILHTIMQHNQVDIVNAGFVKVYETDACPFPLITEAEMQVTVYDNPFEAFLTQRHIMTGVWTRLYKRTLLKTIQFNEGIYFEDVPFTTKVMSTIGKLAVIKAPLYYYFQNAGSILHTSFNLKKVNSYIEVIQLVYRFIAENRPDELTRVRRDILNKRFKMMVNQAIRNQKNKAAQIELFTEIGKRIQPLFQQGMISYDGLKPKHRLALFLLRHNHPVAACRLMRLV